MIKAAPAVKALDHGREPWRCGKMKKITVTVDDDTYRRVRIKAAEQNTSV
jgi:hypothetical protein